MAELVAFFPAFRYDTPMSREILIIEDEEDIARLVAYNLEKEGYQVVTARTGVEGLQQARKRHPDLVILDLMIPEMDGLEVCKAIRSDETLKGTPILMLTAKAEEMDRIIGLELGADDYMTKPFSTKELAARVKALLRRVERQVEETTRYAYGPLALDVTRHEVRLDGREIQLTAKEFKLLETLLRNRGRVQTREILLDTVWGYDADVTTRTVDVHIRRLREKIPILAQAIVTVKSLGYKLKED